jgi:hypothetical protein
MKNAVKHIPIDDVVIQNGEQSVVKFWLHKGSFSSSLDSSWIPVKFSVY